MDQCDVCGSFVPRGDRYCSKTCKRLDITKKKVFVFCLILAVGATATVLLTLYGP